MRKTKPNQTFWAGLCYAMPPIPALSVTEWADEHRVLSGEASFESGKYSSARIPMQREPMDAVTAPDVGEIILMWAAQTAGKSELLNNICGYFMHADPSSQLMAQPTIELTEAYSKERIATMIRDTPALRKLVRDPRSRDSGNTVKSKVYPGGNLAMVGANAPSGLAGRPRRVILLDEIDRFPVSAGSEGDPCALADKRAEAFANAVKVKTSTPTIKGASRIENLLEQSDYRKWHCACPRCSHDQVWMWEQVKWPKDTPEEAWIECAKCGAHLSDDERVMAVKAGQWKPTKKFRGVRGYWLNGINTLFRHHKGFRNRLHEMAEEFLKAKAGGKETMRAWVNTFLAETFEEPAEESAKVSDLVARAEDYAPDSLPNGLLVLVAGCDVQKDRVECLVAGFGIDQECWLVERKVFDGDPEGDEVWANLDEYLLTVFRREDGVEMKIDRTFIDMRHKQPRVAAFCRPRLGRGVYPCQGVNKEGPAIPPLLPREPSRNNKARIPHWNVGTTRAKTTIFDRLQLPLPINAGSPAPRVIHFTSDKYGFTEDFFKQLTSEKRRTLHTHGVAYYTYIKPHEKARNEALDMFVYALAALEAIGPISWHKRAEMLKRLAPKDPEPPPTEEQSAAKVLHAPVGRMASRGSFATNW